MSSVKNLSLSFSLTTLKLSMNARRNDDTLKRDPRGEVRGADISRLAPLTRRVKFTKERKLGREKAASYEGD